MPLQTSGAATRRTAPGGEITNASAVKIVIAGTTSGVAKRRRGGAERAKRRSAVMRSVRRIYKSARLA